MKFAYADPPYLGCGARIYGYPEWDEPDRHRCLIKELCEQYPEGWALSLHVPSLQTILPMCPTDVRVGAWCKTYAQIRPRDPQAMWEPVIWRGGRPDRRDEFTPDWLLCPIPGVRAGTNAYPGQKPRLFSIWMFRLLGAQKGDDLEDLFPGSGAVTAAWQEWIGKTPDQLELINPLKTA